MTITELARAEYEAAVERDNQSPTQCGLCAVVAPIETMTYWHDLEASKYYELPHRSDFVCFDGCTDRVTYLAGLSE